MARPSADGSVFRDANGDWWAKLEWPRGADGRRRRRKRKCDSEAGAWAALSELRTERDRARAAEHDPTVAQYVAYWLREGLPARGASQNTQDNYAWAATRYVIPLLGQRRLRELTAADVEAMLRTVRDGGLSRSSLRIVKMVLRLVVHHAERHGLVAGNVVRVADTPSIPAAQDRPRRRSALGKGDQARLYEVIDGHRLAALWKIGLFMGLRPGELTGLRWSDVDLEHGVLWITGARIHDRKGMRLGPAKTEKSKRTIAMPPFITDALVQHREAQDAERRRAGDAWTETGAIFTTKTGGLIDRTNLATMFTRLLRRAGITQNYVPHELRHTYTSVMSDLRELGIEEISDLLGHVDTRMVATVYRHSLRGVNASGVTPAIAMHEEILDELHRRRGHDGQETSPPERGHGARAGGAAPVAAE